MVYTLLEFMYLGMCCTEGYQQLQLIKFVRNLSCGLTELSRYVFSKCLQLAF